MTISVIQWATGGVGRAAIEAIAAHPELELVGVWVHSDAKVGVDAGELAGIGPLGVAATNDVDALLALGADCIVYAPLMPDEGLPGLHAAAGDDRPQRQHRPVPDRRLLRRDDLVGGARGP